MQYKGTGLVSMSLLLYGNAKKVISTDFSDFSLALIQKAKLLQGKDHLFKDPNRFETRLFDVKDLNNKIPIEADLIVIGTPNYFDNVPGLMKDFIDRTVPFYETDKLKGKKLITIVTGGEKIANSKKVAVFFVNPISS